MKSVWSKSTQKQIDETLKLGEELKENIERLRKENIGMVYQPAFPETVPEYKRYYVEYSQACGWAVNVACVVIKAKDLKDLHRRLKDKDFGKDEPGHTYCVSYYVDIEDKFDDFIKNITKGISNVDCIIEIINDDVSKINKEIIDAFKDEDYSKTIICTEYEIKNKLLLSDVYGIMMSKGIEMKHSNNILVRAKNLIRDSINSLWL